MLQQQSIEIRTKDSDKLKQAKNIISDAFADKVSLPSTGKTLDSPNKEDIGNLSLGFRIVNPASDSHKDPFGMGNTMIGHLRSHGVKCHRSEDKDGILNKDLSFHDIIVLD